jgi:hypothetical protein
MRATATHPGQPLAAELRRVAAIVARGGRPNPFLPAERVAAARPALLEIADDLATTEHPDPRLLRDVRALVRDGVTSPLLNRALPAGELDVVLRGLRFRAAQPSRSPGPGAGRRPRRTLVPRSLRSLQRAR